MSNYNVTRIIYDSTLDPEPFADQMKRGDEFLDRKHLERVLAARDEDQARQLRAEKQ